MNPTPARRAVRRHSAFSVLLSAVFSLAMVLRTTAAPLVDLHLSGGGIIMSADGTTIAGTTGTEVWRWSEATGFQAIGFSPLGVIGINANGSCIMAWHPYNAPPSFDTPSLWHD